MPKDDATLSAASAGSYAELRERFAAAALTGLLSNSLRPEQAMSEYVRIAAAYADAMLREREKTIVCDTKKPVAWIAFATDGSESSAVYMFKEQARAAADAWNWCIAPLYRSPALTDDEKDAIAWFADYGEAGTSEKKRAKILKQLLARLG